MSPLGFSGSDQLISSTLAPAAFTLGGGRPSGTVSKVLTYMPPPTPQPSTRGKQEQFVINTHISRNLSVVNLFL